MGRHPFAGRYLGSGDMPIERAIKEYRFAFSAKASNKQIEPPPNALDLSVCSSSIRQFFEKAFSEEGSRGNRPTAREWLNNLDAFRHELCNCKQNQVHQYYKGLSSCPWCKLENLSGTTYFLSYVNVPQDKVISNFENIWKEAKDIDLPNISKFLNLYDLNYRWTEIENLKSPTFGKLPDPMSMRVIPNPLPDYAQKPGGIIGFLNLFLPLHDDKGERKNRQISLEKTENNWKEIKTRWLELVSNDDFKSTYKSIEKNILIIRKILINTDRN